MTGAPLSGMRRAMFSLEMKPIPEIEIMKTMPEVIFPLFWVQEGVSLGKKDTDKLKNTIFL